ncbi:DNA recombinase, partial [Escherichia coli]
KKKKDFVKANHLLLRKIIQSVTVYEENFVISFKSGIELEV